MEPRRLLAHRALSLLLCVLSISFVWADTPTTRTTSYTYYPNGLKHTEDGPRTDVTDVTAWEYVAGAVSKTTNALGHIVQVTQHTAGGLPLTIIDANGLTTTLTYDLRDRLKTRTVAGRTTTYEYDGVGQLTKVIAPDGSYLAYEYDAAHRLMAMSNNLGERMDYSRDLASNITRITFKSSGGALRYAQDREYDALSRLHKVLGQNGQITTNQYDPEDNPTASSDVLGNGTIQTFDALNRLSTVTDAEGGVVTYTYNAQDRITSVTDAKGNTTTYNYDGLGNLLSLVSPDTGTTAYDYDAAGNKTKQTDARGVVSLYSYDALNRLTAISYPATPSENATYTYDSTANGNKGVGQLTGYSNDSGSTTLVYDNWGNVTQKTDVIGSDSYTFLYSYDTANRLSQITYPSGRLVTYLRDSAGQITEVKTQASSGAPVEVVAEGIIHLPWGGVESLTYGNGLIQTNTFDLDYRMSALQTDGWPQIHFAFSYDGANNITAMIDQNQAFDHSYNYDALYRLISDTNHTGQWGYSYDANGNRTERSWTDPSNTSSVMTLTSAPASNRLTQIDGQSLSHTAAGNLSQRGSHTYEYNAANRWSAYKDSGALIASLRYNAQGERVEKVAGNTTAHFHYSPDGQLLGVTRKLATTGAIDSYEYVYLDSRPLGQITTTRNNQLVTAQALRYLHADHLGTPRIMSDGNGVNTWIWDGDAFGSVQPMEDADGNSSDEILNLRFAGQYYDEELGTHYNYFRDHDPTIGRYIQSDPIGLKGGMNTYAYVNGNPLQFVDPLGLQGIPSFPVMGPIALAGSSNLGQVGQILASPEVSQINKCTQSAYLNANAAAFGALSTYVPLATIPALLFGAASQAHTVATTGGLDIPGAALQVGGALPYGVGHMIGRADAAYSAGSAAHAMSYCGCSATAN